MFANNWAEMPQYFIDFSNRIVRKEDVLHYVDEVNQEIFKRWSILENLEQLQNEKIEKIAIFLN
jgi:hypothetical protein